MLRLLSVSTFAAVILVSGLATSSLTQAAISVAPRPEQQVQGAVAWKVNFLVAVNPTGLQEAAYTAVLMGEQDRRDLLYRQLDPQCPVGDCRWEALNSLGICVALRNITDGLEVRTMDHDEAQQMGEFSAYMQGEDDITFYNLTSDAGVRQPCAVLDASLNTRGLFAACSGLAYFEPDNPPIPHVAIVAQDFLIYKSFAGLDSFVDANHRALKSLGTGVFKVTTSVSPPVFHGPGLLGKLSTSRSRTRETRQSWMQTSGRISRFLQYPC